MFPVRYHIRLFKDIILFMTHSLLLFEAKLLYFFRFDLWTIIEFVGLIKENRFHSNKSCDEKTQTKKESYLIFHKYHDIECK